MAVMQDEQIPAPISPAPPPTSQHQERTNPQGDEHYRDGVIPIGDVIESGIARTRLFKAASDGDIELLFEVHYPRKAVLLPLRTPTVSPEIGSLDPLHTPSYLVLEPVRCQSYAKKRRFPVREARVGYVRSFGTVPLRRLDARNVDDGRLTVYVNGILSKPVEGDRFGRWGSWGFYADGVSQEYPVSQDELLIQAKQLYEWAGWRPSAKPMPLYFPPEFKPEDGDEEFMSPELMRMCEAAQRFWANDRVIRGDRDTYPSQKIIARWLFDCGFDEGHAKTAAILLLPDWAGQRKGRRSR